MYVVLIIQMKRLVTLNVKVKFVKRVSKMLLCYVRLDILFKTVETSWRI